MLNSGLILLRIDCLKTAQCAPLKHHYDACAERVQQQEQDGGKAEEDCVEECMCLPNPPSVDSVHEPAAK